ncbi:AraC family transcriptional regulator [Paenibacillus tengchongensis]|uniref:AraC family transcriptional regulator n=1 Tax=Paenibacillus tengchongensis TaxID=2608684 RepID=UPI0016527526|nr:AraC family transcriptional regulator [Paenibacillus tengchongensis]
MNAAQRQLIQLYLSNLQVKVTAIGYNQVWTDWRELDYTPDYNKFYFICDGEGWLKIGDEEYHPQPGQWFLMPEGVRQSFSYTDGPRYTKYWCHFTAKIGQSNLFDLLRTPFYIHTGLTPEPLGLFRELLACRVSDALSLPLLTQAAMLKLISYYIEHAADDLTGVQSAATPGYLQEAISYMDMHYNRNLTVIELAERVHLHPNYFIRIFKRHFGLSPIQYINRKKIEEAKWLLLSTDLSLSGIGEQVGIPDVSYFSKLFKAFTGFSPTAFRMQTRPH